MKKVLLISLSISLFSIYCFAQKEANIWKFAYTGNGLSFNQLQTINSSNGNLSTENIPTSIPGSRLNTLEGCFTLSDSDGNLMMYSDGMKVYNKNDVQMPNGSGLAGGASSTQSGIVIPMPGDYNKYYIVTVAEFQGINGICYSIVDMTLEGGLGNVTIKNQTIKTGSLDENIAAVRKPNTEDYWLVYRRYDKTTQNMNFYVWELTASGFSSKAVTYGSFDPATGTISDLKCRNVVTTNLPYGVEFSRSGEHVFIADEYGTLFHISWNDLCNTANNGTNLNCALGNIQLGPDGRIYGVKSSLKTLFVIMDPESGAGADIRIFNNFFTNNTGLGLPTFAATWFALDLDGEKVFCMNDEQEFTLRIKKSGNSNELSYPIWDFGNRGLNDVVKDANFTPDNKQTQKYIYTRPGKYKISVKSYDDEDNFLKEQTMAVIVSSCVLPVNPNIHLLYK